MFQNKNKTEHLTVFGSRISDNLCGELIWEFNYPVSFSCTISYSFSSRRVSKNIGIFYAPYLAPSIWARKISVPDAIVQRTAG